MTQPNSHSILTADQVRSAVERFGEGASLSARVRSYAHRLDASEAFVWRALKNGVSANPKRRANASTSALYEALRADALSLGHVVPELPAPAHYCHRCGHEWNSRSATPAICPRCKSQLWAIPKR